jgi:membrane protein YdbS with pleckstrin-like domain
MGYVVADNRFDSDEHRLEHLDRRVVAVWRVSLGLTTALVFALLAAVAAFLVRADVIDHRGATIVVLVAVGTMAAVAIWFGTVVEWRRWRYAVREDEVEIRSGWLMVTHTLMPISRIQHVDVRQGVLDRHLGIASLIIHTAAGGREIPGLSHEAAYGLRSRLVALANIQEDL